MTRPTIATVHQQLNDNIEFSKERFDKLDTQLSILNGSFRNSVLTIEKVQTIQNECPARSAFTKGRVADYLFKSITIIIACAAVVIAVQS